MASGVLRRAIVLVAKLKQNDYLSALLPKIEAHNGLSIGAHKDLRALISFLCV